MNIYEIKGRLLDLVAQIDDEAVLAELYKFTHDIWEGGDDKEAIESLMNTASRKSLQNSRAKADLPKYFSY